MFGIDTDPGGTTMVVNRPYGTVQYRDGLLVSCVFPNGNTYTIKYDGRRRPNEVDWFKPIPGFFGIGKLTHILKYIYPDIPDDNTIINWADESMRTVVIQTEVETGKTIRFKL